MAINFPNSPTIGQQVTNSTSGVTYTWSGTTWQPSPIIPTQAISASLALNANVSPIARVAVSASTVDYRSNGFRGLDLAFVFDNYRVYIPSTGNASLVISCTAGSATVNGVTEAVYNGSANTVSAVFGPLIVTTSTVFYFGSFNFGNTGDTQRVYFNDNSNRSYKITCIIQPGYVSNIINVEKLY